MWQLKNSTCNKIQTDNITTQKFLIVTKPKLWENSKTQVVSKPKNLNCDKTRKKSNCDKGQELKLWQNLETHIVTNLETHWTTKLNSNCDVMQKPKLWQTQNSYGEKTQNWNCDNSNSN